MDPRLLSRVAQLDSVASPASGPRIMSLAERVAALDRREQQSLQPSPSHRFQQFQYQADRKVDEDDGDSSPYEYDADAPLPHRDQHQPHHQYRKLRVHPPSQPHRQHLDLPVETLRDLSSEFLQITEQLQRKKFALDEREAMLLERERALLLQEDEHRLTTAELTHAVLDRHLSAQRAQFNSQLLEVEDRFNDAIEKQKSEIKRLNGVVNDLRQVRSQLKSQLSIEQTAVAQLTQQSNELSQQLAMTATEQKHLKAHDSNSLSELKSLRELSRTQGQLCGSLISWLVSEEGANLQQQTNQTTQQRIAELNDPGALTRSMLSTGTHKIADETRSAMVLSLLGDVITNIPSEFEFSVTILIQWILMAQQHQPSKRNMLLPTYRRIAEAFGSTKGSFLLNTKRLCVRVISAMCVLLAHDQIDKVHAALLVLLDDVLSEEGKYLFLDSDGLEVISRFLSSTHSVLVKTAAEVLLAMAQESGALVGFLEACSVSESFMQGCCSIYDYDPHGISAESLSVVLQRLSRDARSHALFESSQLASRLRRLAHDLPPSGFHALNVRSIVDNLARQEDLKNVH